ncbi:MAG: hypothetical protein ACI841_002083 [Planctomycetota bacterium]|jgi:hypothetical protein
MFKPSLCLAFLGWIVGAAPCLGETEKPDLWSLIERGAKEGGAQESLDTVLAHMAGLDTRRLQANRLSRVTQGLTQPWSVPGLADDLQRVLARPAQVKRGAKLDTLIPSLVEWLDGTSAFEACTSERLDQLDSTWLRLQDSELEGVALLRMLSLYCELSHALLDESLAGLEPEEWEYLFSGYPTFFEGWYRNHFPNAALTPENISGIANLKELLLTPKTDTGLRLRVTDAWLRIAEPDFLNTLPRRLTKVSLDVDRATYGPNIKAVIGDEAFNRVIVSGKGKSKHAVPAALIIDLGGDDSYERAATVDSADMLLSVVLDLGGDDIFSSSGPGPAFALGGVALLVDRKGDDRYVSTRLGQAATVLGSAIVIDYEGDDQYSAQDYAQGHATCGLSLLYDFEGNDTYSAWAFAQGGGIGYGVSALVDADGNDIYLADLHWPDVYGDSGADVYHGASQGYCTGIRSDVAGGIGALIDLGSGQDRYQSGSFSQGGGYFFSFGLMYDGGGDDENFGSRYSQGFGVHQAIGVRWDAGGNDSYNCRSVAHTGMAWDEGVGFLIEDSGDDTYNAGALACGGAAQTGIAICIDRGGRDSYKTASQSQGGTGGTDYHKKPSLGVLIDLGGQADSYSGEGRDDGTVVVTPEGAIFMDLKERDIKKALKARSLK